MTAREAATLLGVHYNTVRNRIKAGTIQAEKVITEHGETWMIDSDTLTDNAPTSADQQVVSRVPEEALTVLAREIVREAGLRREPEREAELEGNKLAMEAAKTQVVVASGLLVGMAAVAGVLPDQSLASPLLYLAFALVVISVYTGIQGMHRLAERTARSERFDGPRRSVVSSVSFILGLSVFIYYVIWNNPTGFAKPPSEQFRLVVLFLVAGIVGTYIGSFMRKWYENRHATEGARAASERPWWRRIFEG